MVEIPKSPWTLQNQMKENEFKRLVTAKPFFSCIIPLALDYIRAGYILFLENDS